MKRIFILVVLLSLEVFTAHAQQDYLRSHAAAWNDGFETLEKVVDGELLSNQLFLIGESHGVQYTHELQFDLLQYLKKKTGFRYLLLELGYLDEIYLNRYLQTGNEKLLDSFFRFHATTFYFNKSEQAFFQKLYALNQALPDAERIRVMAVDLEFAHRDAIAFLQREWLASLPASQQVVWNSIATKTDSAKAIIQKFGQAYDHFTKNTADYQKHLGPHYEDARHLLENIHQRLQIAVTGNSNLRDSVMVRNFQYAVDRYGLQAQKMVGLMGSFHVKQEDQPNDPRFAAILHKKQAVKGIASFVTVYHGGEAMIPARSFPNAPDAKGKVFVNRPNGNGILSLPLKEWELLDPFLDKGKGWLFRLDGRESPFATSTAFTSKEEEPFFTTQLFQVLILINGSPATLPYDE